MMFCDQESQQKKKTYNYTRGTHRNDDIFSLNLQKNQIIDLSYFLCLEV